MLYRRLGHSLLGFTQPAARVPDSGPQPASGPQLASRARETSLTHSSRAAERSAGVEKIALVLNRKGLRTALDEPDQALGGQ